MTTNLQRREHLQHLQHLERLSCNTFSAINIKTLWCYGY
jgi:hypothetical protein